MTPPIDYAGGRDARAERQEGDSVTLVELNSTLVLGALRIQACQLYTPEATAFEHEAARELGIRVGCRCGWPQCALRHAGEQPPMVFLVELDELADFAEDTAAYGAYVRSADPTAHQRHTGRGTKGVVLVQRGLPALVERAVIRHELAHWAQDRRGELEVFDAGAHGRWWVSPPARRAEHETEAVGFGCDARYWADRIAAGLVAPAGWRMTLERVAAGRFDWRVRRYVDGELVEELVPAEPSPDAASGARRTADMFLEAARRTPSVVDRLNREAVDRLNQEAR